VHAAITGVGHRIEMFMTSDEADVIWRDLTNKDLGRMEPHPPTRQLLNILRAVKESDGTK
jgi:hypothetical protein